MGIFKKCLLSSVVIVCAVLFVHSTSAAVSPRATSIELSGPLLLPGPDASIFRVDLVVRETTDAPATIAIDFGGVGACNATADVFETSKNNSVVRFAGSGSCFIYTGSFALNFGFRLDATLASFGKAAKSIERIDTDFDGHADQTVRTTETDGRIDGTFNTAPIRNTAANTLRLAVTETRTR